MSLFVGNVRGKADFVKNNLGEEGAWTDSTAFKTLPLNVTNLGSIPDIPYGLPSAPGVIFDCRARNEP